MIGLKCENISKQYNQPLLDKVSFIFNGEGVIGLIGDNGSGKSTLLKILSGEETQFEGKFQWTNAQSIGYMPQEIIGSDQLSGGQKKIEKLAELLYGGYHDVVLLDEPDNHLDFDGKDWLQTALEGFPGLVIMISHDRDFLAKTTQYTWLVEERTVRTFPFGYEKFEQVYGEEQEYQHKIYGQQQKEQKRLEELVKVFRVRAASNKKRAAAYHNMVKRLDRHKEQSIADPKKKLTRINLDNRSPLERQIKGKTAILIKDLEFSYGDKVIFNKANLHLTVKDKIVLVAPNGTGKSTLIKLLLGELTPTSGVAKIGNNLEVGYYSQEHSQTLLAESTPIKQFMDVYPIFEYEAERVLRKFLFTKQTMRNKIGLLSGGQKARLQLALFLYRNPDILILDEPTNHLDIKSIQALENFFIDFKGTVLLISHDRELIDAVGEEIFTIKNGRIERTN